MLFRPASWGGGGPPPTWGRVEDDGATEKRWEAAAPRRVGRIEDNGATGGTGGGGVTTAGHGRARGKGGSDLVQV